MIQGAISLSESKVSEDPAPLSCLEGLSEQNTLQASPASVSGTDSWEVIDAPHVEPASLPVNLSSVLHAIDDFSSKKYYHYSSPVLSPLASPQPAVLQVLPTSTLQDQNLSVSLEIKHSLDPVNETDDKQDSLTSCGMEYDTPSLEEASRSYGDFESPLS